MKYKVLRSDIAESQLTDILRYITHLTGDTASALSLLDEPEEAPKQLEDFPESGIIRGIWPSGAAAIAFSPLRIIIYFTKSITTKKP